MNIDPKWAEGLRVKIVKRLGENTAEKSLQFGIKYIILQ